MRDRFSRRHSRSLIAACLVTISGSAASAADQAAVAGTYCLRGVMEVGSCLRLSADGTYEYFLAYGAYDETSEGTWRIDGGEVILDSPPYDKRPAFTFKRQQAARSGGYDVIVESKAGQPIQGVDVTVACDGKTTDPGITQLEGYNAECASAPTAVKLGLAMFGVAPQSIDVSAHAGPEKGYVFAFEPGDLGKKKFAGARLKVGADALDMTYSDTPIEELSGKPFRYARERQ